MTPPRVRQKKMELLLCDADAIPTLPGVAHRLLPLAMTDPAPTRNLQQAIESDAALAARALRLALRQGHAAAGLTSVAAICRAVPADLLAAELLSTGIIEKDAVERGHLARLWRHNLAVGIAAQIIAQRAGTVPVDDALLAGLLHDIGQVVLAVRLPLAYGQVYELVEAGGIDLLEAERRVLGLDHAVLGRRLAQHWGLAEPLQNVLWLHHQTHLPIPEGGRADTLTCVIHLADLLARQAGFAYHPSDEVHENPAEVAERLSLSGVQTDQLARQVLAGVRLNAAPAGYDDVPTAEQLCDLLARANARLGRLHAQAAERQADLEARTGTADLLVGLNARLAGCGSAREVLAAAADAVRQTVAARLVAPYVIGGESEYVEGLLWLEGQAAPDPFLYEVAEDRGLESLLAEGAGGPPPAGEVQRAERAEGWLFERLGPRLGAGPFYTVPMVVDGRRVGGLVFAPGGAGGHPTRRQAHDLAAAAALAATALERAQADADLNTRSEELAEVTRELQAAQDAQLEQRNVTSLGEMAAGAAHEINNPLAIISGRAQQLALDETVPARREVLQTIIQQARRISDIIAELNEFARPPKPELRDADPAAILGEVVAGFQPPAGQPGAAIRVEAAADVPRIRVDPRQVADALRELVQNAVEACGEKNTIVVSAQVLEGGKSVRLTVADDGPGMDPQVRARVLDPFYSSRQAGRRRGLGLPKAYRLVRANGGTMGLESVPGKGTTVRLTFAAIMSESSAEKLMAETNISDNPSEQK